MNRLQGSRVTEHDRQIAAIRKVILAGVKLINDGQVLAKENRANQSAGRLTQRETDLHRGRNGHGGTEIR
jgi:hypothetical protein